ncbi:ABC transporter permease [Pusillimonas sp. ANT_WB101]|uniref:ABC transporter permease n=1 Tax=Pusillimonas sp. ANT_WB101 TaxID=2597356 RepID=UPI0011EBE878|nr:ABC transporter permease [Pusillimonas sp. ANT_WB101]KAA0911381.1 sugar ABC transporter permease [Pusillimonas sp. ANT_WB101]
MKKRSSLQIVRSVLFALVLRELQTRFGERRMGAFWILFESMAHIVLMMFIFGVIRGRHVPGMDFAVYLGIGLMPFFLMRNIALKLMDAVNANRALFAYPNITPFDTFVARAVVEFLIMASVYVIIMAGMALWFGYDVAIHQPLQWLASLGSGILFSFGLGLIFCVVVEIMPNAKSIIRLFFMPLYFISAVIFPLWQVPGQYLHWLLWNPYLHIIDNLRRSTFSQYPVIDGISFTYPMEMALITLFLGLALYRLRRRQLVSI